MIIEVSGIINDLYVDKIVSFKYYMENINGYKVTKESSTNIYQNGYFYNPNKGWMYISSLGNPRDIKSKLRLIRINNLI